MKIKINRNKNKANFNFAFLHAFSCLNHQLIKGKTNFIQYYSQHLDKFHLVLLKLNN
jgi:hypothetical protein